MCVGVGDVILDVGCGTGLLALHVSETVGPSGRVIGIDPSQPRIKLANYKLAGQAAMPFCKSITTMAVLLLLWTTFPA